MIGQDMLENINSRDQFSYHPISKGLYHAV